jgi:hypothetical protein
MKHNSLNMNASVISRLVGILSSKDSHLRSNELCFLNTMMQTLTWIGGLLSWWFFFFFFFLPPEFYIHHTTSKKKCEETRDTIRRPKQSLSFSRRHYSIRNKKDNYIFYSLCSICLTFVREKTSFPFRNN